MRRLALSGAPPRAAAVEQFAHALGSNSALEALELGCNFLGERDARTIATGLQMHPTLRTLSLEHNPLQDGGVAAICDALTSASQLTHLYLPFTGAADGACASLSRALLRGVPISHCDLGGNLLSAEGAAYLAAALVAPQGCALLSLSLSANSRLGAAGALELSAALPSSQLAELQLAGCAIGAAPCGRIGASLGRAASLKALDLSSNEIGDMGAWDLAWALSEEGTRLERLSLARNEIEDDGAAELCTAIEERSGPLRFLDLNGNRIDALVARLEDLAGHCAVRIGFQLKPRAVAGPAASAA